MRFKLPANVFKGAVLIVIWLKGGGRGSSGFLKVTLERTKKCQKVALFGRCTLGRGAKLSVVGDCMHSLRHDVNLGTCVCVSPRACVFVSLQELVCLCLSESLCVCMLSQFAQAVTCSYKSCKR